MVLGLIKKVFGTKNDRDIKRIQEIVDQVNSLESSIKELSDEKLKAKTNEFKDKLSQGSSCQQFR